MSTRGTWSVRAVDDAARDITAHHPPHATRRAQSMCNPPPAAHCPLPAAHLSLLAARCPLPLQAAVRNTNSNCRGFVAPGLEAEYRECCNNKTAIHLIWYVRYLFIKI